jgi:ribosomal protein S17E
MSVAVIIQRYKNTLNTIPSVVDFLKTYEDKKQKKVLSHNSIPCITTRPTIGGLVYGIFKNECKKKDIKFAKLPTFVYNELMRCKVAGRVEMFNGVKKIEERMASLDVCSLYPYVLAVAPVYYPCGEMVWEKKFAGFDKFGFYWVSFTQDLRERNLPNIYPLKTETENDWNSEERIENVLLSTTTIKLLEDYGVEYEFVEQTPTASTDTYIGFTFSEYRKSCDMFEFVLEIMKLKNEQDTLKQIGDKSYNAPLRETLKLLMNAISGKVIEDYHTDNTLTFDTNEDFWNEMSKVQPNEILAGANMPYKSINCVNIYGDRLVCRFETHKRVLQENSKKEQRPIYLGSALYDYAKAHMYRHSYSQIGLDKLVYTDTDATKTTYSNFELWKKYAENTIVPHHKEVEEFDPRYATHKLYDPNSKVFGSFEDELEECKSSEYEFYCLQKKCWLYRYGSNNKFRFKGVNGRSCPISSYDLKNLEWVEERQVKNMVSKEVKISYGVRADKGRLVNDYHNTHTEKHLGVGLNATKFFRALYEDRKAYVLCSSFRKHASNSIMSIEDGVLDMNKTNNNFACIEQVYTLKQIILK